jgi:hypothetical protein
MDIPTSLLQPPNDIGAQKHWKYMYNWLHGQYKMMAVSWTQPSIFHQSHHRGRHTCRCLSLHVNQLNVYSRVPLAVLCQNVNVSGHSSKIGDNGLLIILHLNWERCFGSLIYFRVKMAAARISEKFVSYHNTRRRHNSEDGGRMDLWNVCVLPQH